jgi:error-prone DNA polymerase
LVVGQAVGQVGQEEDCDLAGSPAAERRKNAAHGVSRGEGAEENEAPKGRKKLNLLNTFISGGRVAHPTNGRPTPTAIEGPALSAVEGTPALRLGLRYVRGLREEAAHAIIRQRNLAPFTSIHDLIHRVPELRKDELNTLAEIGALNSVGHPARNNCKEFQIFRSQIEARSQSEICNQKSSTSFHRRDALWQIERSVRRSGPLLDELSEPDSSSPLRPMNPEERLVADFRGTGLTVGPHPMAYHRAHMNAIGVRKASDLAGIPDGKYLRIGGCVIARQRPGTAKGFVFLSLEDESGVANAIIMPDLFQKNRLLLSSEQFLMVEGVLQNQDNVISVKARKVMPLSITQAETSSHDFY